MIKKKSILILILLSFLSLIVTLNGDDSKSNNGRINYQHVIPTFPRIEDFKPPEGYQPVFSFESLFIIFFNFKF
jgi:hypothetical protein